MPRGSAHTRKSENEFVFLWIQKGILFIKYKPGVRINRAVSKKIFDFRMAFQNGKAYPVICFINGVIHYGKHACDFTKLAGLVGIDAISYVGDHPMSWSLVNFYIDAYKPTIPTFLTNTKEEAIEFLKRYMGSKGKI